MRAPGPNLVGFALGLRRLGFLDYVSELWREHGDVFEVRTGGRPLMFALHPDAVRHINVSNKQRYDKAASYDDVRDYLSGAGLVASTGELWRRQRKLMAPFFTPASIRTFADLMLRDATRLAERWDGSAAQGGEVDMGEEMSRVTAAIILGAMFGTDRDIPIEGIKESVEVMVEFVNRRRVGPNLPLWVPTPGNLRYKRVREFGRKVVVDIISERKAADPSTWPDDLLTRLMNARDEDTGEAMSDTLLRDESLTIFFAGHETTARTMTFVWYALAANPEVEARLHEELDRELGGREPTVADLERLPYTLRVVKEVLRLYPAVPIYARDAVEADTLGGFDVAPGTAVLLSSYHTHRHPDFWDEPERFDPDRWTPDREAQRHRYAFHPFAAGPRICLGNNFSVLESHLLLAVLGQRFRPRLPEGHVAEFDMTGVLGLVGGLPMRIERRRVDATNLAPPRVGAPAST
jgi:cytochrome P450